MWGVASLPPTSRRRAPWGYMGESFLRPATNQHQLTPAANQSARHPRGGAPFNQQPPKIEQLGSNQGHYHTVESAGAEASGGGATITLAAL